MASRAHDLRVHVVQTTFSSRLCCRLANPRMELHAVFRACTKFSLRFCHCKVLCPAECFQSFPLCSIMKGKEWQEPEHADHKRRQRLLQAGFSWLFGVNDA